MTGRPGPECGSRRATSGALSRAGSDTGGKDDQTHFQVDQERTDRNATETARAAGRSRQLPVPSALTTAGVQPPEIDAAGSHSTEAVASSHTLWPWCSKYDPRGKWEPAVQLQGTPANGLVRRSRAAGESSGTCHSQHDRRVAGAVSATPTGDWLGAETLCPGPPLLPSLRGVLQVLLLQLCDRSLEKSYL